jgi:hypothetical protein
MSKFETTGMAQVLKVFNPESVVTRLLLSEDEAQGNLTGNAAAGQSFASKMQKGPISNLACSPLNSVPGSTEARPESLTLQPPASKHVRLSPAPPPFIVQDTDTPENLASQHVEGSHVILGMQERKARNPSGKLKYSREELQVISRILEANTNSRMVLNAVDRARLGKSNHPISTFHGSRSNNPIRPQDAADTPHGLLGMRPNNFLKPRNAADTQQRSFGAGNSFEGPRRPFKRMADAMGRRPEEAFVHHEGEIRIYRLASGQKVCLCARNMHHK